MFRPLVLAAAAAAVLTAAPPAQAGFVVFAEDFNPSSPVTGVGYVLFNGDPQFVFPNVDGAGHTGGLVNTANANFNAIITQTSTSFNGITTLAQDGPGGWYLLDYTASNAGTAWASPAAVAVNPNQVYTFSFYLTDVNGTGVHPSTTALINGVAVGGPVTPAVGQWTQYSYTWNSGSATSATLSLSDNVGGFDGNDYGIDTIRFTTAGPAAVPEPASLALVGVAGLGLLVRRRLGRTAAA